MSWNVVENDINEGRFLWHQYFFLAQLIKGTVPEIWNLTMENIKEIREIKYFFPLSDEKMYDF